MRRRNVALADIALDDGSELLERHDINSRRSLFSLFSFIEFRFFPTIARRESIIAEI
jgi:hypothetical protein